MSDDDFQIAEVDIDAVVAERIASHSVVHLPSIVSQLLDVIARGAPLGQLTRLIERDPVLAANVMRLAVSPAYAARVGEDISLPYAVMRLGKDGLRCVALTSSLAKVALIDGPLLGLRRRVWRECLAAALACHALATERRVPMHDGYLAGLMHDFGKIAALLAVERDHVMHASPLDDAFWVNVMERHHCDAGWVMADAWGLPEDIAAVIARHHFDDCNPLHTVVRVGDLVVERAVAQQWQISAQDIARIPGVDNLDEAMALRIGLARHPFYLTAIAAG